MDGWWGIWALPPIDPATSHLDHGTLPEWFGFVPIKIDYTDLPSVMAL
jgi:hypothetical protein